MSNHTHKTKKELLAKIAELEARLELTNEHNSELPAALLRTVLDNANHGVLIHREHKPLYANSFLSAMYGYESAEEIMSLTSMRLLTHPDFHLDTNPLELHGKDIESDRQIIALRKDKSEFWEQRRTLIIDFDGQPAICSIRSDITAKIKAEQELRRSEKRLSLLFSGFKQGILIHRGRKALFSNPSLAEMYGYESPDEILNLATTLDLISPKDRASSTDQEARLKGASAPTREEYRGLKKDGTEFWISRRGFVIDWDGEPAICSVRVDISEQKNIDARIQASQKLVEQERNKLHDAINSFKDGFALFSADDKLEICNQSYIDSLDDIGDIIKPGVSFEEALRARAKRNQRQDGILRDEAFIQKRLEQHRNPTGHFERTFSDGKSYQIHEFRTQGGGIVVFRIDVSEQKKSEKELRLSQERLTNAIESLKEGLGYFDADDRLVACNQKFMETRPGIKSQIKPGITYEEFLRIPASVEDGYDDEGRDEAWIKERLEQHRNPKGPLYRALNDGRTIQVDDIKTKDGGVVTVRTDITDLKRIETQARESEERYRHFAADVAHELRTPLSSLFLQLNELGNSGEVRSLKETVNAMSRTVEQLLALARLDALVIHDSDTADLSEISTKVSMQLGPIAIKEGRILEVLGADNPVIIKGNAAVLEQAVRNLVENAIRYSHKGSLVTTKVDDLGIIKVIDRGEGIPAEIRDSIFNRFERADRRGNGSGLGLSLVQRTVGAHGGTINISDTPGSGATFTIDFSKSAT